MQLFEIIVLLAGLLTSGAGTITLYRAEKTLRNIKTSDNQ